MSSFDAQRSNTPTAADSEASAHAITGNPSAADGDVRYIPLSMLVPSPLNVRKNGGHSIDELAMLIDAHGLLHPLTCIPRRAKRGKSSDKFEVVAGGRRLRALQALAGLGKVAKDEEILCTVTTRERAVAVSMAENSGREDMSVADLVQAFAAMAQAGGTVEEIAVAFGITPLTVKRRLRLANVSPKLFELFRAGTMSLEQMMALAITDDHAAQERVWTSTPAYQRSEGNLRRLLLGQEVDATRDSVALFVGVEAYEAAGGVMVRDLFEDAEGGGYIGDVELLHRLARARLEAEAGKLQGEGWAWVEVRTSFDYTERHQFGEAPVGLREPTDKERAKLEGLKQAQQDAEATLEAMYELGEEEGFDQDEADSLEKKAEDARKGIDKLHTKMRRYTPEVLAVAGTVVTIEHGGRLVVHRGLVRPQDRKLIKSARAGSAQSGDGDADEPPGRPTLSESLCRKLTAHRTKALQVKVAGNPHVALASVVHSLVQSLVIEHCYHRDSALNLRGDACDHALMLAANDMKGSKASDAMQALLASWRDRLPAAEGALLPWLLDQEREVLLELLAVCAALTINTVTARMQAHAGDVLASAVRLDMADFWSATGTSYFAQVSKAQIVEAVGEAVSPEVAVGLSKLKKGEAVARAEELVAGTRWLPAPLKVAA